MAEYTSIHTGRKIDEALASALEVKQVRGLIKMTDEGPVAAVPGEDFLDGSGNAVPVEGLLKGILNEETNEIEVQQAEAGVDYQTPLTAGVDYATPTAVANKQNKITATGILKNDETGMTGLSPEEALANIGAAPAGYGLGVATSEPKDNDLNKATACGWYGFTTTTLNRPFGYGSVMVTNRYTKQITQMAFNPLLGGKGEMCVRHFDGTTWSEWEYINSPMFSGVEYRTTERWNGRAVYTKLVDFGALPQTTTKSVAHGASCVTMLGCRIILSNHTHLTVGDGASRIGASLTDVYITTSSNLNATATAQIWYTKD